MAKITEEELKSLLAAEIRSAITYDKDELTERRTKALEYYRGEMVDTPPMANRSSVVSRDVADTIGWMLPGIIRVFTASDRMAEFEPATRQDEEFAKQATDYINHVFMKDNPGYRILWDATHDSLLQGNGIVKHYWDDTEECTYEELSGHSAEQIAMLQMDEDVEIVGQKQGEPQKVLMPGPDGQPIEQDIPTFDLKIKRVTSKGRICVECIEPESFMMDRNARFIEEARFCAHRDELTRSDLIEMGFDRDTVEALPTDQGRIFSEAAQARDETLDGLGSVGHESTRTIELFECYVKADADGDGIAETIRAYYAGGPGAGELLDWEVWEDDVPFSDIPCEPVPHRWDARSVSDETMDVQRIKTVLSRQMLDNLYASNLPMQEAEQGSIINPEMLIAPKFGGIIWRKKGAVGPAVIPQVIPFIGEKILVALQHFDNVVEKRTGVSRATMALDPDTLQNQTATANQNQRDAAYSQIELIARNQAELGWRRVFRQMLKITIKHQDRPRTIRLRDKWVDIDPRPWNSDMDVTVNVGLGTGSRDRDMAMMNNVMGVQATITQKFAEGGFAEEAIDMIPRFVQSATKLTESAGVKNPDSYFPQFPPEKLQQMKQAAQERASQPDPKIQAEKEKAQADGQIKVQTAQLDAQIAREKMMLDAQLKREQMQAEIQLKREQLSGELILKRQLAQEEMQIKREAGFYKTDTMAASRNGKTSGVHMGGDPG